MFSSIKIAIVLVILGTGGFGYMYIQKLQADVQTARDNVAKMEIAVATAEASIKILQEDQAKIAELNRKLSSDLQKAEAYGDDLRKKLNRHNLTALALDKPGLLEGRMNNATAKLWRELEQDTGGAGDTPPPSWLRGTDGQAGTTNSGGNGNSENNSSNSNTPQAGQPK